MGQNEKQVRQLGQQIERLWEQISKKDEQIKDLQQLILLLGSFAVIGAGATARPIKPIINPMLFLKYLMLRQF